MSIRGINTAATLWCAAAAGALAGSGYVWQAGLATAAVLAINIFLRPVGRLIDRQPVYEDSELETTYRFHATRKTPAKPMSARSCSKRSPATAGTNLVDVSAELVTLGRNDEQIETAAGRLGLEPNVTAVRWQAIERNGQASLVDRDPAPDE